MTSRVTWIASAAALALMVLPAVAAQSLPEGSFQVAQAGSCRAMQSTCAARCKERAPQDKNCVSDHCTPKLSECRQTGCWQEGKQYGGGKTCGLAK